MMELSALDRMLADALERGASDVHLKVGSPPVLRVKRQLIRLTDCPPLSAADIEEHVRRLLPYEHKLEKLEHDGQIDIAYALTEKQRFRVNVYRQRDSHAIALRSIRTEVSLDDLGLPAVAKKLALQPYGIVLVTGPAGTGKSTTLAGLVDYRNEHAKDVIVTVEDPMEFLFEDKNSYIVQREIGIDTQDFAGALRSALREDPDVIMVGEMRDLETIRIAVRAAETGHLVFSTLHTLDAKETLTRIVEVFAAEEQALITKMLANTLRAIFSQRLIPRKDGTGLALAVEVLVNEGAIPSAIEDQAKLSDIQDLMQKGGHYGMQTLDQSIFGLYRRGLISYSDAMAYALNPTDLSLKMKGIGPAEYT